MQQQVFHSQIKGYRLATSIQKVQAILLIKVYIPYFPTNSCQKILCKGQTYSKIPILNLSQTLSNEITAIIIKDQNEELCHILEGMVKLVKVQRFKHINQRIRKVFGVQIGVDVDELFFQVLADQINPKDLLKIFDLLTQTQFVQLLKKIFQNTPNKILPKIYRKFNSYFTSSQSRSKESIERLKRIVKIAKSTEQQLQKVQLQQTMIANKRIQQSIDKTEQKIQIKTKRTQTITKVSKNEQSQKRPQVKQEHQKHDDKDWQDLVQDQQSSDNMQQIEQLIGNISLKQEQLQFSNQQQKKKKKNAITVISVNGVPQKSNGQKKKLNNKAQKVSNNNKFSSKQQTKQQRTFGKDNQPFTAKSNQQRLYDNQRKQYDNGNGNGISSKNNKRSNDRNDRRSNDRRSNDRRDFSKENKKIDSRILLGIDGATDLVWREKIRPPKYPQNQSYQPRLDRQQDRKQDKRSDKREDRRDNIDRKSYDQKPRQQKVSQQSSNTQSYQPEQLTKAVSVSKNLSLQRVYCIPQDLGKGKSTFHFIKRDYNIFVNNLFWVNISNGQITIQKQGKGYIRKSEIEIIDNGKGFMADGITLNIDGISNLEDGGIPFGNPIFEDFTPNSQWFQITQLEIYAYM